MRSKLFATGAIVATMAIIPAAQADLTGEYLWADEDPAYLDSLGFVSATPTTPVQVLPTECEGCYSFGTVEGPITDKGYMEIDILFTSDYFFEETGMNVLMQVDPTAAGFADITEVVTHLQAADTGDVEVLGLGDASNSFCDWSEVDAWTGEGYDVDNTLVFRWHPDLVLGQWNSLSFAWDFSEIAPGLLGGGFVQGVGATPAPGALALLGLAGLAGRRRRH